MSNIRMLLEEIRHRKINFALSLTGVVIAAALFVAAPTLIDGYARETDAILTTELEELDTRLNDLKAKNDEQVAHLEDETRKAMRDMGFNLLILHKQANMHEFWATDFAQADMPQEYVERLAAAPSLTLVTHLVATLQQRYLWNDRPVLLVGYLPEATQSHRAKKKPMGYRIESGTVYLGHLLGLGHQEGDDVQIGDKTYKIAKILPEQGSKEDIMLAMSLEDAQELVGRPGRINQILALGCQCAGDRLQQFRGQLAEVLPEAKIIELESIASARAKQRDLVAEQGATILENEKQEGEAILAKKREERTRTSASLERFAATSLPLVVLASAIWVGLSTFLNVRERRFEIGLLRALGKNTIRIATLFLGKALLLGAIGGAIGFLAGTGVALAVGRNVMQIPSQYVSPAYDLLPIALVGTPLLCVMAAYLPTLMAVVQNPAIVLREQ